MMRIPFAIALTAGITGAQSFPSPLFPDAFDLAESAACPLMVESARLQQFYEVAATAGVDTFDVHAVSFRFDGPDAGASASTQTIQSLTIEIGVTERSVDEVGATFGQNLSEPLHPIFGPAPFTYVADANATDGPEAWGGPGGQFRFVLAEPLPLKIPIGGAFVVQIRVAGNSNTGGDAARLDAYVDHIESPIPGTSIAEEFGCPYMPAANAAIVDTIGQFELGTAFHVSGSGFPPQVPVGIFVTAELLQQRLMLPGSPGCYLYVDPSSGFMLSLQSTSPIGDIPPFTEGMGVPLPRTPDLCGALLYVQNIAPVAGGGFVASNYRTIEIGCPPPALVRGWQVESEASDAAQIATGSHPGGIAIRIE